MSAYILAAAAIILVCLILSKISGKLGVPTLALFIFLGMAIGSDGLLKIHFDDFVISERICTVALIFIIFYGGFGTSWTQARPVAVQAALLSSLGVVITAGVTGVFCHYVLGIAFWESMLIGAVVSSTDAASVFSILRSKKLNLKHGTASMLEVESGSNDPFSYMLTVIVLSIMKGDFSSGELATMLTQQLVLGAVSGVATGAATAWVLSRYRIPIEGFDAILVFSITLVAYAGADILGGNGYLGVYIFGIILGNKPIWNKKNLVHFFDGVTGLMQMLVFFLLGLLSFPSQLIPIALPALGIALFLTFIARPLAVFAMLSPFRCPVRQQVLVSWTGLRGAASIVFAIMATVDPAQTHNDVFHITFFIVLFSIFTQGSLISFMAGKLRMIDENASVMKTFSDYSEEVPLQFVNISIDHDHPWAEKYVREITMIPDFLLVMILRGEEKIIPKGDTRILVGDLIVITSLSVSSSSTFMLSEVTIHKGSAWTGKPLAQLPIGKNHLVIAVKREDAVIIPHGKTVVQENDILVMSCTGPGLV